MKKVSAKQRLLDFLKEHANEWIQYSKLREVGKISDWARSIRTLRQEGWKIETRGGGVSTEYILNSLIKSEGKKRDYIDRKLRAKILRRDSYRCIHCGRNPEEDSVKLHIDHKIPVDWGGKTIESNLQTLCEACNLGKKADFADYDSTIMKKIINLSSGMQKLLFIAKNFVNKPLNAGFIGDLAGIRDWTRSIRKLRQDGKIDYIFDRIKQTYTFLPVK